MTEFLLAGVVYAFMGAVGGLARVVVTGKGIIAIPQVEHIPNGSPHLNLGALAPLFIGALAGYISQASRGVDGVVSALAGYAGSDGIENIIERRLK